MPFKVLVIGSINTDLVTYVERMPAPGETVPGGDFGIFPGGKGANQAVAAARAGVRVEMFGCVGADAFGRESRRRLKASGVSVRGVKVLPGVHSGIAQILVDGRGENCIAVAGGANGRARPSLFKLPSDRSGAIALMQNEIPLQTTIDLIRECYERGMRVLWNCAPPLKASIPPGTLAGVEYLIVNRLELKALCRDAGGDEAAQAESLIRQGAKQVLVTLGGQGSLLAGPQETVRQAAFPVQAVDTVGAGDCFCGVFAAGLAQGLEERAALRRAAAAAAISVTRKGAQTSMPFLEEIESFLAERD